MKKNIALILIFLFATNAIFGFISTNIDFNDVDEASYIDNKPIYNATAPTLSENEYLDYYATHNIYPKMQEVAGEKLTQADIPSHLSSRFSEYTNWQKSVDKDVSSRYGKNPINISEYANFMQSAKSNASITRQYLGCGPIAIVSQLIYLAENAGYCAIDTIPIKRIGTVCNSDDINDNRIDIATKALSNTPVTDGGSAGSSCLPIDAIRSCSELLDLYGLATKKELGVETDRSRSQIHCYGDTISSTATHAEKKASLIESIDRGMPVIWWTGAEFGEFQWHYMNIFGYEYWEGTDVDGNYKSHLFFKLRFNHSDNTIVYMDSDLLSGLTMGFIFFEETHDKCKLTPSDYSLACEYFFYEKENTLLYAQNDTNRFDITYLRTGVVNHYDASNTIDANYLSLSANRQNAGLAYLSYKFYRQIDWIFFDIRWWSSSEGMGNGLGTATLQYKDSSGNWTTAIDFIFDDISTLERYPTIYKYSFPAGVYEYRFVVERTSPTTGRNKGRLVVGDMNIVFSTNS